MKKESTQKRKVILKLMLLISVLQLATISQSMAMENGEPVVAIREPADGIGSGPNTRFVPISEAYESGHTNAEPVVAIRVPADGLGSGPSIKFVPISEAYRSGHTGQYYHPSVQASGGIYRINESTYYNCKEALRGIVTEKSACIFGSKSAQTVVHTNLAAQNKFLNQSDYDSCLSQYTTRINAYSTALDLNSLNNFFKCTQDKSHAGNTENEKLCRSIPSLNRNGGTIVNGTLQESYASYGGILQEFPGTEMLCLVNRRYDALGNKIMSCAREHNIKINRFDQILIRENELKKISTCILR